MALRKLDLDDAVIHPDRAAIGKGEIVGSRGQSDIIEDQVQFRGRDWVRILSSIAWNICSVRSMRVRAGARTCN